MKLVIVFCTTILLAGCLTDESSSTPTLNEQASTAFENGDFVKSIDTYSNAYAEDSTDAEAYMGMVRSYVELVEPDTLFGILEDDSLDMNQLLFTYLTYQQKGYFDSLDVLNEIVTDPNSELYQNLTPEEKVEVEAVRAVTIATGSVDELVDYSIANPDVMQSAMDGELTEEQFSDLFFEIVGDQIAPEDSLFINDMLKDLLASGYLDSLPENP